MITENSTFEELVDYARKVEVREQANAKEYRRKLRTVAYLLQEKAASDAELITATVQLQKEFGRSNNYYSAARSLYRLEKLIEVPIGTYSSSALRPLRRFWPYHGKGGSNGDRGVKPNPEGIERLLKAWGIAKELTATAKRELPSPVDIASACAITTKPAKNAQQQRNRARAEKISIKTQEYIEQITKDRERLQAERDLLKSHLLRKQEKIHALETEIASLRRANQLLSNRLSNEKKVAA